MKSVETTPSDASARELEFAAFVASGHPRHIWFARAVVRNQSDAEDLLQDALLRLLGSWRRHGSPENANAYLMKSIVRLAGRRARKASASEVVVPEPALVSGGRIASLVNEAEADHSILGVLRDLPLRQRSALGLRFIMDQSVGQTAVLMGCSESTVKALTAQGLRSMRAKLEPTEQENDDARD